MRDRLEELRRKSQEFAEAASEDAAPVSEEPDDDDPVVGVITQQAVVFEVEPVIDNFLSEAQKIRDDITALEIEVIQDWLLNRAEVCTKKFYNSGHFLTWWQQQVLKFSQQQKSLVASMRRFSVIKKESSVTRDIKLQAESLHRRMDALSKQVHSTEEQHGPAAVTTRIQRSQYAALNRKLQQVGKRSFSSEHSPPKKIVFKWISWNKHAQWCQCLLNTVQTRSFSAAIEQVLKYLTSIILLISPSHSRLVSFWFALIACAGNSAV